jgi:hypothetical protein
VPHLIFDSCKESEEIPNRVDWLAEAGKPMMMRHDPPHPLPETLFGIQLRGIGGLGSQEQSTLGVLHDGFDWCTVMLANSVMNH